MTVWEYIVYTVFLCVAPAGVICACRRFPLLGRLGPIMVLYAVGMVVGNMPFLPEGIATLQEIIPNVMIPLAIPINRAMDKTCAGFVIFFVALGK